MTLIIDQLTKARQIILLWMPKAEIDDEAIARLIRISGIEDFEAVCQRANSYARGNGRLPSNLYRWLKNNIYFIRNSRMRKEEQ
jgi:hypothetical protein